MDRGSIRPRPEGQFAQGPGSNYPPTPYHNNTDVTIFYRGRVLKRLAELHPTRVAKQTNNLGMAAAYIPSPPQEFVDSFLFPSQHKGVQRYLKKVSSLSKYPTIQFLTETGWSIHKKRVLRQVPKHLLEEMVFTTMTYNWGTLTPWKTLRASRILLTGRRYERFQRLPRCWHGRREQQGLLAQKTFG